MEKRLGLHTVTEHELLEMPQSVLRETWALCPLCWGARPWARVLSLSGAPSRAQ